MAEVSPLAALQELAASPKWLALSAAPAGRPLVEPSDVSGYLRAVVTENDWDGGKLEVEFGPARVPWDVRSVALLNFSGDPIVWLDVEPAARVEVGLMFAYDLTLAVTG